MNASPDVREQLEPLAEASDGASRATPVAGIVLTDAEIDHTAGLLLLREASAPLRVYGSDGVRHALTEGFPVLPMLGRYCGVEWQTLAPGEPLAVEGSTLEIDSFPVGGDAPRYLASPDGDVEASGLSIYDRMTGGLLTYVPGLANLDEPLVERLRASDAILVDGTFWRDDELELLGIAAPGARAMGHIPLSGPDGTLAQLARLDGPRKILVHMNNTNPILLEDAPERRAVVAAGVEVAHDGMEIEL